MTAPTRAHYQLGLAERNIALLNAIFTAQEKGNHLGLIGSEILATTCLARNLSPSIKRGMAPLQLITDMG